ncbi:Formate dehydrogenase family accessory protein FdhD [Novosphingobium resinovorum]|uniref:Sulfur carrier protein FdhD n=1 Tax=Novosphingobium resinovorum TaxID=158500 RepID=A0A031K4J4_9SPHN|nr:MULTISPECIES: formate dehydrogenase accessory sulfurtransferase FdhD [Novosphingobium]EZP83933.1 Formate dehydrogenase family accessory protein FdhD [Novosphingobium resinovorum]
MTDETTRRRRFQRNSPEGSSHPIERELAEEVPIALEFNGIGYAVLMGTPADIEDLVGGFLLAERLQTSGDPVVPVALHRTADGIVARANLPSERTHALLDRVRHRASDSSCGLCGIENIEQAIRPLPAVTRQCRADDVAVFRAASELHAHQALNARTGAVHAAALVDAAGAVRLVREDVGRHNAFDKLIGAMRRADVTWDGGFALLSSRCSYELVEKAVLADCPMLATISAPTHLAVKRAVAAGLALRVLVRPDALLALTP